MIPVRLIACLGLFILAGCDQGGAFGGGPPPTGQALADAQTRAACRQRAEEAYRQQNRAQIYSPPPQVNTPYSANYLPDQSDRGLADLYSHDKMVSDCIRNTGTGALPPQPAPLPK